MINSLVLPEDLYVTNILLNQFTTTSGSTTHELILERSGGLADLVIQIPDNDTLYTAGSGIQLVSNEFAIDAPICPSDTALTWNGSEFICESTFSSITGTILGNIIATFTDINGATTDIQETVTNYLTSTMDHLVGSYTNEAGIVQNIYETLTSLFLNTTTGDLAFTDETGTTTHFDLATTIDNLETLTTVTDNGDGTFTYTDEN